MRRIRRAEMERSMLRPYKALDRAKRVDWSAGAELPHSMGLQGQVGVKMSYGFYATEIIFEGDVLVGGVGVFVGQAKANEHAGDFEGVVHLGHEGNGAAFADEYGALAETFFQGALRFLENGRLKRSGPGFAGTE